MAIEIIMPKAGVSMEEGTISCWLKKEGEKVVIGDPILEIITDKVNMEVEAEGSGVLATILKEEGEILPVFTVIGVIAEDNEDINEVMAKYKNDINDKNEEKSLDTDKVDNKTTVVCNESKEDVKNDTYEYDLVVIGGGPGGYISAIKGAMLGGKVAIVEMDTFGGTCLNRGCIPTKTYLRNVELIEEVEELSKRGINVKLEQKQDISKILKYKNRIVKKLTSGVEGLLKSHSIDIFKSKATVNSHHVVIIDNGKTLMTKNIILANGSKAKTTKVEGINSRLILNTTQMLDLETIPSELAILGGGAIACEFAQIFNSRGSKVTIITEYDKIIPNIDKELSESLSNRFTKKGIKILINTELKEIREENGKLLLNLNNKDNLQVDLCLDAINREANLEGLEKLEVKLNNGFIKVNEKMETSLPSIYAIGDVTGVNMQAHVAFRMGEIAASNAMGKNEKINLNSIPTCIYTVPQIASIGITEEEAKEKYNIKVGKFNFASNGQALASSKTDGYIKVICDKKYGEILGIHIYGSGACEIINQGQILKELEIPADEGARIMFAHPSMSEVLMEALGDVDNNSLHLPK